MSGHGLLTNRLPLTDRLLITDYSSPTTDYRRSTTRPSRLPCVPAFGSTETALPNDRRRCGGSTGGRRPACQSVPASERAPTRFEDWRVPPRTPVHMRDRRAAGSLGRAAFGLS